MQLPRPSATEKAHPFTYEVDVSDTQYFERVSTGSELAATPEAEVAFFAFLGAFLVGIQELARLPYLYTSVTQA